MAKILVVDDSEIIRVQLKADLEGAGHQVVEAVNGLQGLEVLDENKDVKLVISDVNMPEMDGLTMCEKIHANPDFSQIPIIMLTTQSSAEMKARGKENGVLAWVTKPYKSKALLAGAEKILSRAE
jgi:two-component system chemotaxis response regulator CheY